MQQRSIWILLQLKKKKNNTAAENQVQLYGDMLEFLE